MEMLMQMKMDGIDGEKRRAEQAGINARWLITQMDIIHYCLCQGQTGTWQERAKQAVEAAMRIANNQQTNIFAVEKEKT